MSFRFITKSIHAYLIDYPVAMILIAAPFALKLGQSGPIAMWLSVVVGVAALLLAALTDHPTGLIRIIPYWLHLWIDRAVGVVFVIAPFAFKFAGLDAWYYWILAAAVLLTTSEAVPFLALGKSGIEPITENSRAGFGAFQLFDTDRWVALYAIISLAPVVRVFAPRSV